MDIAGILGPGPDLPAPCPSVLSRAIRAAGVPLPKDLEHTELGVNLHNLEGQVQAMEVREIDSRDGAVDGRLQHGGDLCCQACNRKLSWNARRCFYCGSTDLAIQPPPA